MAHAPLPVLPPQRRFGETLRRDAWWLPNVPVLVVLTGFVIYATWAAFQNANYYYGPYLSPFYSPELLGESPHALFGPKPGWWPSLLPFSPALFILPVPALFRFTCYYYRGAYYKAFWADPPGCAVGEPRKSYLGENSFPLVLQNLHRYGLLLSVIFLFILGYDAARAFWFTDAATNTTHFGIGVGSIIMVLNVVLLSAYTFGCHATRHVVGGMLDRLSASPIRKRLYDGSSWLNRAHMRWAWFSLFGVALTDLYIRMCAMGIWHDVRLF
jgi:hypothetical protein